MDPQGLFEVTSFVSVKKMFSEETQPHGHVVVSIKGQLGVPLTYVYDMVFIVFSWDSWGL